MAELQAELAEARAEMAREEYNNSFSIYRFVFSGPISFSQ
jgi:hypothetical protein